MFYYNIKNWKWIVISSFIIVTYCQALKQGIGEECTNTNGTVGICQLKNKCTKFNDLGSICNLEQAIICCNKNMNKLLNSSISQNVDDSIQSRSSFITDFYQVPISSQIPLTGVNIFYDQKQITNFVSKRPVHNVEQNIVTQFHNNNNNNNNNNQNLNVEVIIDDHTARNTRITQYNYNYPIYETQRPNQNQNNNYPNYQFTNNNNPNYIPQVTNQNNNNNRPYQETFQSNQNNNNNRNPNDYTSTQKPQDSSSNIEYNSQFPNSQTNSNSYEENNKPNKNTNYRPTSSSISFPNNFEDNTSNTKFTTTTIKYQNRPNVNTKQISEIKCEEYTKALTTTITAIALSIGSAPKPIDIEKCKLKSIQLVVGGIEAELDEFPHMVAVGFNSSNDILWNCGGTLISDQFVLTAAHCMHSSLGNPVRVRLGDLNLRTSNDGARPIEFMVDKVIVHPDYVSTSKYNDIALLSLNKKVKFNNGIRPACLYNKDNLYATKVTATGWGSIGYGEKSSDHLLKVNLDVIDNPQCNKLYEPESKSKTLNRGIIDSMLCAGVLAGGKDTCLGDSGGPLVLRSEKNACIFNLIGITSFGKFCATENAPGVYTRVSAFIPWIEQIVWP